MSVTFLRPLQLLLKNHNVLRWRRSTTGRKKIGRHLSHRRWCLLPLTICCCKIFSNHLLSQRKNLLLQIFTIHGGSFFAIYRSRTITCKQINLLCGKKAEKRFARWFFFFVHVPTFEFMKTFWLQYYYELRFLNDHICIEN